MIVVSGALAVIAFILLIAGLVASGLALVYASIVVSAIAFIFLGIGAYQRRGEDVARPAEALATPLATPGDDLTRIVPISTATETPAAVGYDDALVGVGATRAVDLSDSDDAADLADTDDETDDADTATSADTVLVVPGRPRYHVAGCRYLAGKDAEPRSRSEALTEGFTACGVCRPDDVLAAAPAAVLPSGPQAEPAEADGPGGVEDIVAAALQRPGGRRTAADEPEAAVDADQAADEAAVAAAVTPTRKTASKRTASTTGAKKTAAKKTATKAPAKTAAAKPATKSAASTTAKTASKSAAKSTAKAAASAPVIVIPDRGKFHKAECRFVRSAEATLELSRADATKQGYEACGVCKP